MMLKISIVCLLKTLNRYVWLFAQTYVLQIIEENLYDMAHFRGYWLFFGWFQVMSGVFWLVSNSSWMISGGFRWFHVVPGRSSF